MNRKDTYGIYNDTAEYIFLLKYSKARAGWIPAEYSEKHGETEIVRCGQAV